MIQFDNYPHESLINYEHPKILEHKGNPSISSCPFRNPCIYILEMQHHLFKYLWKNNFSTPITEQLQAGSMKVLEVGLASEIWTFDMANNYPLSTFIGLNNFAACDDKSNNNNEPLNATVLRTHASSIIPFPDETFDFICQRFFLPQLITSLNEQSNLIKNMIRVLKPCGWVEFMIFDLRLYNSGPYTSRLTQAYDSYTNNGRECSRIDEEQLYNMLISTQRIQSIVIKDKHTLLGANGGRIGELLCDVLLQPLKSHKSALSEYMGICIKEFDEMYIIMLQEINDYKTSCISHR
ncbi:4055_t:CDS:2 [Funneliformis mosseae]|uniref:4055_t:CDS:1 n=1 Tax=Funneliformis mosseae TaxID=27381 RepID=A0A9N8VCI2_FUNMO|nr:4055_t:CDS:2 [Funneliformis mosseae]